MSNNNAKNALQEYCQKNKYTVAYDTERAGGLDHMPRFRSFVRVIYSKSAKPLECAGDEAPTKTLAELHAAEKMLAWLGSQHSANQANTINSPANVNTVAGFSGLTSGPVDVVTAPLPPDQEGWDMWTDQVGSVPPVPTARPTFSPSPIAAPGNGSPIAAPGNGSPAAGNGAKTSKIDLAGALVVVDLENQQDHVKSILTVCGRAKCEVLVVSGSLCPCKVPPQIPYFVVNSGHRDAADVGIAVKIAVAIERHRAAKIILISRDHFAFALKDCIAQLYPEVQFAVFTSFGDIAQ